MSPPPFTPTLAGHKLLILQGFTPPAAWLQKLHERFPGLQIDYRAFPEDEIVLPPETYQDVTMILTFKTMPSKKEAPNLTFIQFSSAGADYVDREHEQYADPAVVVCTSNGAHPPQIAEWVVGTFLSFQHRFPLYQSLQNKGVWDEESSPPVQDAVGLRMGILGYGAIGRQCARIGHALGMKILAFTLRERPTPESRHDDSYCVPGTGDPEGLLPSAWYHGSTRSAINDFLSQSLDILVICLPLTPLTRGIIGAEQFAILSKRKTFVSNVGRGAHIVTADLIEALEKGQIRGAALDVTDPEPLPKGHPLWTAPNVIITPHVSWSSVGTPQRICEVLEENLGRLGEGRELINRVDRGLGY